VWANAIPLVTLLGVVFSAGFFVSELRAMHRDLKDHRDEDDKKFKEIKDDFNTKLSELKTELDTSSTDQGRRIGNLEAEQRAMAKADDVRREFSGRHVIGRDEK
jgi:hypothetical protein